MEINKELLERYHQGNCTATERAAVEAWLQEETFGDEVPVTDMPENTAAEMWAEISTFADKPAPVKTFNFYTFGKMAAAAVLLLLAGAFLYRSVSQPSLQGVSASNFSPTEVKNINVAGYNVELAPNSNIKLDAKTGLLHFCGSLLFSPKSDMELSFAGLKQKVKLKTGQKYIVLSTNCPSDKPIIINEKDVYNLPPVMQRQLSTQFSI
ncbi:hypothetical protein [Mucilaginibacter pedocola]|uniref:Uncharacterized protein n=1 Tax=Mucilaginibacter pedocola TaxID=1792845 RepID=A0A1S9PCU1_9SPHI|nr:hypothetical protein [Mucilaginibacter pedocola]OOQ58785.1 hypothetical protein BC343_09045 [Mucilaginibacter pedocola]